MHEVDDEVVEVQLGSEEAGTSKADCATNSRMEPLKQIGVEAR